jgi:hypothetical protein
MGEAVQGGSACRAFRPLGFAFIMQVSRVRYVGVARRAEAGAEADGWGRPVLLPGKDSSTERIERDDGKAKDSPSDEPCGPNSVTNGVSSYAAKSVTGSC